MLFNSFSFLLFFPLVFLIYWFLAGKQLKAQNLVLLVASLVFYGSWDYRFLFLLAISTFICYYSGLRIAAANRHSQKKMWLWISITLSVGILALFKYYDFFATSFAHGAGLFGLSLNPVLLHLVLPVGISFYTFHGLSYVLDLYYDRIKPEKDIAVYSLFVSFFPLLVAGPIERATHFLPQLNKLRTFDYTRALSGLRQILWGMFKKVVVADSCAKYADMAFDHSADYSGFALVLGVLFFTIQIYCDFSGYSDIALGTARLLGIELLKNFAFPYFSRDIAEFWRRWHISLTTWFRDYLYIPLGGSRGSTALKLRNTFIIFLVSGFWHGANWTFIVWGILHAIYFVPLLLSNRNRKNLETIASGRLLPNVREFFAMAITFLMVAFAWIFFRAESVTHAFGYIAGIFTAGGTNPNWPVAWLLTLILFLLAVEWLGRASTFALESIKLSAPLRWSAYVVLSILVFVHLGVEQEFIYFQF